MEKPWKRLFHKVEMNRRLFEPPLVWFIVTKSCKKQLFSTPTSTVTLPLKRTFNTSVRRAKSAVTWPPSCDIQLANAEAKLGTVQL